MKKLLPHFFVSSSDGGLYNTRVPGWHQLPPLRAEIKIYRQESPYPVRLIRRRVTRENYETGNF